MSWVKRLGRTLRDTVGVGEDGDGGVDSQDDVSKNMKEIFQMCSDCSNECSNSSNEWSHS